MLSCLLDNQEEPSTDYQRPQESQSNNKWKIYQSCNHRYSQSLSANKRHTKPTHQVGSYLSIGCINCVLWNSQIC